MKKVTIFSLLLACALVTRSKAQVNYVMNPSFELHSGCPDGSNDIASANNWNSIDTSDAYCAPTYCNKCENPAVGYSVPGGGGGTALYYHYPRTGQGMSLNTFYSDSVYEHYARTYLQGKLFKKLTTGKSYCVTFYVSIVLGSNYAVNHIGAYLDNGSIDSGIGSNSCGFLPINYVPQIVEDSIIADTAGFDIPAGGDIMTFPTDSLVYERSWVKVQGTFIATGTENFITLANFDTLNRINVVRIQAGEGGSNYLIDDVSVVESDAVADAGPDVIIHPGDSTLIGNDTAAVGGGDGMPCWWYIQGNSNVIDSGGRILVHPDTTTTYVMMMDLCGNITYDTVTVNVWPAGITSPAMQRGIFHVVIAPNPATDQITVNGINKKIGYKLTNILGMPLAIGILQPGHTNIDLSGYPSGSYLLELEDPDTGTKIVRRVVRE